MKTCTIYFTEDVLGVIVFLDFVFVLLFVVSAALFAESSGYV